MKFIPLNNSLLHRSFEFDEMVSLRNVHGVIEILKERHIDALDDVFTIIFSNGESVTLNSEEKVIDYFKTLLKLTHIV